MDKGARDGSWLETLPKVKKGEEAPEIPHLGGIPQDQLKALEKRGYRPVDIRFVTDSERLINLAVQGQMMGTVELTANMLRALDLRARMDNLLDKNRARQEDTPYGKLAAELFEHEPDPDETLLSKDDSPLIQRAQDSGTQLVQTTEQTEAQETVASAVQGLIDGLR